MTSRQVLQIAIAIIAAGTPWLVTRVALEIASAHAKTIGAPFAPPLEVRRLTRATLLALPLVVVAAWWLPPPSLLMGAIDLTVFAALSRFGWPALQEIDRVSQPARDLTSAQRVASLRARRPGQYLPLAWRAVPFAITGLGVILLVWRLASDAADRLFVPIAFILAAPIFVWLYEVWIRAEVSGGEVIGANEAAADQKRSRRVRRIFAVEVGLAFVMVTVGHTLLGLNWIDDAGWVALASVTGALAGILGCALALSSDLSRRRYRALS